MNSNQSRTQFESWYQQHFGHSLYLETSESGVYLSTATGNLYAAWEASRAASVQPTDPELAKLLARFEQEESDALFLAEGFIRETGRASISALQRKFKIGYERACRLMGKLTERGVVTPIDSEGRRSIVPEVKP